VDDALLQPLDVMRVQGERLADEEPNLRQRKMYSINHCTAGDHVLPF